MDLQGITGMLNPTSVFEPSLDRESSVLADSGKVQDAADHKAIVEAARQFEAVFLNQLMKAMRKTVPENKLFNSGGPTKFYQQMQDAELSKAMASQNGGLGIADLIVQQLSSPEADPTATARGPGTDYPKVALPPTGPQVETYRRNSCLNGEQSHRVRLRTLAARQGPAVADTLRRFEPELQAAAVESGLDPELILAVVMEESGGDPNASSPKGAQGLMQLMPATARELGVEDSSHPGQNLQGGSKYLARMLKKYEGNLPVALAAYNAGPGTIDRFGKTIPGYRETQEYVDRVLKRLKGLGGGTNLALPKMMEMKPESNSE